MWDRITLKEYGKAAFKANYWKCVLVAFLAGLTTTSVNFSSSRNIDNLNDYSQAVNDIASNMSLGQLFAILGVSGVVVSVGVALVLLVLNPLAVGCEYFFLKNSSEKDAPLDYLGRGFKGNYWNAVLTMFMKDLFLFLWSLLFVIPGIIKSYSYRMVKYIIAENPDMSWNDAITLSRKMMDGNKWRAFVLDLSFIGWILLGILTLGILIPFYVSPYMRATNAELYKALRDGGNPTSGPMEAYKTKEPDKIITFEAEVVEEQ